LPVTGPESTPAGKEPPPEDCRNCGRNGPGRFCPYCGQRRDLRPLSLPALLWDLLVEILDTDARVWRTLRTLILRPGRLTLDWTRGRRADQVPPFRLYLVLNVLAFLVLSMQAPSLIDLEAGGAPAAQAEARLEQEIARLEQRAGPGDAERVRELREALALFESGSTAPAPDEDETGTQASGQPPDSRLRLELGEYRTIAGVLDWLAEFGFPRERLQQRAETLLASPLDLAEAVFERIPTVMFVLLPLMATVMWLLYLLSGRPWVVHLVGLAHLHAFIFLLILLIDGFNGFASLIGALWIPEVEEEVALNLVTLGCAALLIHLVLWLRRLYGHGWLGATTMAFVVFTLHLTALVFGLLALALVTFLLEVVA